MAVIQYSALVTQLRGKLGGSQFNKGHAGYTLQRKSTPTIRQTPAQLRTRQIMNIVQRRWKDETPERRQQAAAAAQANPVYNRLGQQVVLSGYNHYIKMMSWRLTVTPNQSIRPLESIIRTTPIPFALVELVDPSVTLISQDGGGFVTFLLETGRLATGSIIGAGAANRGFLYIQPLNGRTANNPKRDAGLLFILGFNSDPLAATVQVPTSAYYEVGQPVRLHVYQRNVDAGAEVGYAFYDIVLQ